MKKLTKYQEGKDFIFAIAIMILMVIVFIYSCTIERTSVTGIVDSGFFPKMGAIIGFAMGVILAIKNAIKLKKIFKENGEGTLIEPLNKAQILRLSATLVLIALYLWVINILGMPLASIIYLFLQMMLLCKKEDRTKKNVIIIIIVAVVMPLAVYFPFRYVFKVFLPMGIFR